ncbi:MAG TPA: threonine synthase [Ardenticatenaceae bacterium]
MRYYSTNRQSPPASLEEALLCGLAPDGGLYYPEAMPRFTDEELRQLEQAARGVSLSEPATAQSFLQEVAFRVLERWFGEDIPEAMLRTIAVEAQSFPMPIRKVGSFRVLELFHGPTMAFKDVAACNLSRLTNYFLQKRGEQAILLVATSGDTGGAIAHGFAGQENIKVVVLFPKGKVSHLQEEQLTRVAPNVFPIEVDGVFDDCQVLVKQAFVRPELRHLHLTSANSINIARLIPQIIPYVYAYFVLGGEELEVVVPSGNFGNLTAALFAGEMGVPLNHFIAATNRNDAVVRYFQSGRYTPNATVQTLSTAMDVGNPSNFARILELFGHDYERFRQRLRAYPISDEETAATIRRVYEVHGYLLDPHSAVAWLVAEREGTPGLTPLVVATASPVKFAEEMHIATGLTVDDAEARAQLRHLPQRKFPMPNSFEVLADFLQQLPMMEG